MIAYRRNMIRMLIFLTVSVIMLAFFMFFYNRTVDMNFKMNEQKMRSSYDKLCDSINEMYYALDKLCSLSDMTGFSEYATRLKSSSDAALTVLNELLPDDLTNNFRVCLAQSGGYGVYAAQRKAAGIFNDKEEKTLIILRTYIREALVELYTASVTDSGIPDVVSSISKLEQLFTDYSPLYYDGEYSAQLKTEINAYERENVPVDKRQAEKIAGEILGQNLTLTYSDNTLSELEVYSFYCNNAFVDITKNGGFPVHIFIETEPVDKLLEDDELLEKALEFADKYGYCNLEPVKWNIKDGIFTVRFCYVYGDKGSYMIDLTASVTVGCTLNKGRICYLDGSRYLMYAGSETDYSAEEGELFIIFDGSGTRRRCREENGVYYDCVSGEKILCPGIE